MCSSNALEIVILALGKPAASNCVRAACDKVVTSPESIRIPTGSCPAARSSLKTVTALGIPELEPV